MRSPYRIILNHWRAKLASLFLATALWLVIRHGIAYTPATSSPLPPGPPPAGSPTPRA